MSNSPPFIKICTGKLHFLLLVSPPWHRVAVQRRQSLEMICLFRSAQRALATTPASWLTASTQRKPGSTPRLFTGKIWGCDRSMPAQAMPSPLRQPSVASADDPGTSVRLPRSLS
eukprot:250757-Chlamydomonas_euryale.AAC.15